MSEFETIYGGLERVLGNKKACEIRVRFNELYDKKHKSYTDISMLCYAMNNNSLFVAYCFRRDEVWNRYAMREVYMYEKKLYGEKK